MNKREEIYFIRFDNNSTTFSIGTSRGFAIFYISTLKRRIDRRKLFSRGIGIISSFGNCELVSFTGAGFNPYCSNEQIFWWSDKSQQLVAKINFKNKIIDQRIEGNKLFVSVDENIMMYSFPEGKQLSYISCPGGLFDVRNVGVGKEEKEILILRYTNKSMIKIIDLKTDLVQIKEAHPNTQVSFIKLNGQATMFVTICEFGRNIHLWSITKEKIICREKWLRGKNPAIIYSVAFNNDNSFLAVSSSTGTIHIFDIKNPKNNRQFSVPYINNIMEYFASTWSFAQIRIKAITLSKHVCSFIDENDNGEALIIACFDGTLLKYSVNSKNFGTLLDNFNFLSLSNK